MYKNILFYLMLMDTVSRATAITLLAVMNKINLPVSVVLLSAFVALLGVVLIIKQIVKGTRLRDLAVYHISGSVTILISFVILHFFPSDISMVETLITGSVLSIILSVTFLVLAFRKRRYVTIQRRLEEEIYQKSQHNHNR